MPKNVRPMNLRWHSSHTYDFLTRNGPEESHQRQVLANPIRITRSSVTAYNYVMCIYSLVGRITILMHDFQMVE